MLKILSTLILLSLFPFFAFAQDEVFTMKKQTSNTQEYFAGAHQGAVMMKVNLLGGVHRPGVYNVPINSELNSVISYAGGPTKEAELGEIMVRSKKGENYEVKKVDLKEFFNDANEKPYRLKPDDYVFVQQSEEIVNNNVFRTSLVISSIVGAILTTIMIDRTLQR